MEHKTKVHTEEDSQVITITRQFDLPLALLFKAYEEPELFEEWMGTKVLKMENKAHGSYAFETSHNGNVVFKANGTIHEFVSNQKITRTFEMENTGFPVQLEFLNFEAIDENTSQLNMQIIFKSKEYKNQLMKMPFASGLNMAHDKLQSIFKNKKS